MTTEPVAIIGLGAVLPDALDVQTAWHNMLTGVSSIKTVPPEIWDVELGHDTNNHETSQSPVAAVVRGMNFKPTEFGMPPKSAASIDDIQKGSLLSARQPNFPTSVRAVLKNWLQTLD